MVRAQLALLRERPDRHDKVEFEIAATCLTPAFADRVHDWSDHGVTAAQINRIRAGLARITAAAIVRLPQDLAMLRESEAHRLSSQPDPLATGRALLARAREAALLLAHLARAAFIATDLLRGLVAVGVINATDRDVFLSDIATVPTRMRRHGAARRRGRAGRARPGGRDVARSGRAAGRRSKTSAWRSERINHQGPQMCENPWPVGAFGAAAPVPLSWPDAPAAVLTRPTPRSRSAPS